MKLFLPILAIILFSHPLLAQQTTQNDSLTKLKPEQQAIYYAKQLSTGALLVRLTARDKAITALKQMGDDTGAEKIRLAQFKENKIICAAFRRYFTYCPVYFFYNTNTDSILDGHMDNIFLDTSLVANPTIKPKESFYLVAEEGNLEVSNEAGQNSSPDYKPVATYTARTGVILMMDKRLNALKSPFPYYTNYGSLKNFWKAVVKLNEKLYSIYPAQGKN